MNTFENKIASIKLLKGVVVTNPKLKSQVWAADEDLIVLREKALLKGININEGVLAGLSKKVATNVTNKLISNYGVDLSKFNSTFFKTFEDTRATSDSLRFVYQMIHYASTYGNFTELQNSGEIFEPEVINEENWEQVTSFAKSFIEIKVFTEAEFREKITSIVTSGLALPEDDLAFLLHVIVTDFANFNKNKDFIDTIKNRELLASIAIETKQTPKSFDELMRIVFLVVTGSSSLVKSAWSKKGFKEAEQESKDKGSEILLAYINQYGIEETSKHVTRYRDFIMLLKTDDNKSVINKILKLSKKNYEMRKVDPLSTITSNLVSLAEVETILNKSLKAGTLSAYRLIRLINATRKTLLTNGEAFQDVIKVRNGRIHIRDERTLTESQISLLSDKEKLLTNFIKKVIGDKIKDKLFIFDNSFIPAAPTSGKTFVGFLPEYSYFSLGQDRAVVGVAWEKGGDIDLHGRTVSTSLGWNSSWESDAVTYTGDMTHLNKLGFAAEFYESKLDEGEILNISVSPFNYTGDYQLIVASGHVQSRAQIERKRSVNQVIDEIVYTDTRSFAKDDNESKPLFSLVKLDNNYRAVVMAGTGVGGIVVDTAKVKQTLDFTLRTIKSALTMEELLIASGATIYKGDDITDKDVDNLLSVIDEDETKPTVVDMRAANMSKDLFTEILS